MTDRFAVREHLRLGGGDPAVLDVDVLGAASDALP
jgi:hypothetical protein